MTWKPTARRALRLAAVLLAAQLLYLAVANALLFSGAIERLSKLTTPAIEFQMGWNRAWSPWPGRVLVRGFHLQLQDPVLQFQLNVEAATVDVVVWELLRKSFRASHVEATGVGYRFANKVASSEGREERLAAFPTLEGYERPALLPVPAPPALTPAEIAVLWKVELEDVDSTFAELWLAEFHYRGPGRARGAFAFAPLQRLEVRASRLNFDGGPLTIGDHLVSDTFRASAEVDLLPLDLASPLGLHVLDTLTASIGFDTTLEDFGVANLYVEGLQARGTGWLTAAVRIVRGRLTPDSAVEVWLPGIDAQRAGYQFTGKAHVKLSKPAVALPPSVRASLGGVVTLPLLAKGGIAIEVADLTADLALASDAIATEPMLRGIAVTLGEAKVKDARPLTALVATLVPVFAPFVLGTGPAVASGRAWVTPEYTLVRLKSLRLGDAELEGAAVPGANGWNGAASGHFGQVPFGLRLRGRKVASALFIPPAWLDAELLDAGIKPEVELLGRN